MVELGVYGVLIMQMLNAFATMVVLPTLPFYALSLGADAFATSVMTATYNMAQMFCSPAVGSLADRIGRKGVLLTGVAAQGFCNCLMSFAFSVPTLIAARTLVGVALSTGPVEMAYIMDSVQEDKELSRVLSLQRIMGSSGALLGPLAARFFESYGFPVLCRGVVGVNALNMVIILCLLRGRAPIEIAETSEGGPAMDEGGDSGEEQEGASGTSSSEQEGSPKGTLAAFKRMLTSRAIGLLLFVSLLYTFGDNISSGPLAVFFKDYYAFEQKQMTYYYMCINLSSICWSFIVPPVLNRLGPLVVCIGGCVGSAGTCLMLVFLRRIQVMPYVHAGTVGLFGTMYGLGFMHIVHKKCSADLLGTLFGLQTSLNGLAGTAGPAIGGALYNWRNFAPLVLTSVFTVLTALLFGTLPKDAKHTEAVHLRRENYEFGRPIFNDHTFCIQLHVNAKLLKHDPELHMRHQQYRDWMSKHGPRRHPTMQAVASAPDLVSLSGSDSAEASEGHGLQHAFSEPSLASSDSGGESTSDTEIEAHV